MLTASKRSAASNILDAGAGTAGHALTFELMVAANTRNLVYDRLVLALVNSVTTIA